MAQDTVVYIENPLFDLAEKFIMQTSRSLFLTGKAGTGKTTFLKKIKSTTQKNTVVLAPTGVAAINAGGTTIHSFFQLPFTPFVPVRQNGNTSSLSDRYTLLQNLKIESEKRNIFRDLELLIIDEVSMVRCDVLDSIDVILRHYRKKEHLPFGGVQLLFIGDLFQLPPVVPAQEWTILQDFYDSPFFFESMVIKEAPPLYIELKQIFRQKDRHFIGILNRVRNNQINAEDLEELNKRYAPEFAPAGDDKYITLSTHNYKAEKINQDELNKLPGTVEYFGASVEGDFPERSFPTDKVLGLKVGAQVMFIKNDVEKVRRYYNGKIGSVLRIEEGRIIVTFAGEEGELEVEKDTWRNVRYSYRAGVRAIEEEVIGTFSQFPLRLAWAVTIHKSQGLTFERAIIDAGSSFAAGQVYVALSRCTSLEGVVLKSRIFRQGIMTDERVLEFAAKELTIEKLQPLLELERRISLVEGLVKIFDFSMARAELQAFRETIEERKTLDKEQAYALVDSLDKTLRRLQDVARKFGAQLRSLVVERDFKAVRMRVVQGIEYFENAFSTEVISPLETYLSEMKSKRRQKNYNKRISSLLTFVRDNHALLKRAAALAENLEEVRG